MKTFKQMNLNFFQFFLLLFSCCVLRVQSEFIKSYKLPNNNYFIIKTEGLYNYNKDLSTSNIIYTFDSSNQIQNSEDIINTIISEVKYNNCLYIICLAKKYIYIYDYTNNNIYDSPYYLSELNSKSDYKQNGVNYKIIPYNFNNNILEFIIVLMKEGTFGNSVLFLYYNINIINKEIKLLKEKKFEDKSYKFLGMEFSNLSPYNISCHLSTQNLEEIKCFYCLGYELEFRSMHYLIKNDPTEDNIFIIKKNEIGIIKIKSAISNDKNLIFACYLLKDHSSHCFLNNQVKSTYDEITYATLDTCIDMETYFFIEKNEFVLLCRKNKNTFFIQRYKYTMTQLIYIYSSKIIINSTCNELNEYSLIYNNTIDDYNLITNYNFLENSNECLKHNIEFEIINQIEEEIDYNITDKIKNDVIDDKEDDKTTENNSNKIILDNNNNMTEDNVNYQIDKGYVLDILKNISKNNLNKDLVSFLENIENLVNSTADPIELSYDNKSIVVTSSNESLPKNITHADHTNCSMKLKQYYNISKVTYKQVEIKIDDEKSLHNKVEYGFYNDKNELLDSSICNDELIRVYYKIKENSTLDISLLQKYQEKNIDVLNHNDSFFNDICYPYSESGNDLILCDRRSDIYQNYSLCEENCIYNYIDLENQVIVCDCKIKENISSTIIPLVFETFEDVSLMDSNIAVAKCYFLVFSFNNKLENIGFWIFSFLLLGYILSISYYFYIGIKPTSDYVYNEMVKYGYLNNDDKKFFEKKNNVKKIRIKKIRKSKKHRTGVKNNSNPIKHKLKEKGNINNNNINNNVNINLIMGNKKTKYKKITNYKRDNSTSGLDKKNSHKNSYHNSKETIFNNSEKNNKINNDEEELYFGLIKKNVIHYEKYISQESTQTLRNYTFNDAIKNERRSFFRIYYIYLLSKQIIFHTFFLKSPLELFPLRICLFIFMLSTDLALNALFYLNDNISKKYKYSKNFFLFAFSDNITIIIYSTLLSYILISLLIKLTNSNNSLRNVFINQEEKMSKNKKYKLDDNTKMNIYNKIEKILKTLKIKIILLILLQSILLIFFWYFVTAFCHVYKSTQKSWLWDGFLSILSRTIIELIFAFFFAKLYNMAVQSNIYTIYRIVLFFYDFS